MHIAGQSSVRLPAVAVHYFSSHYPGHSLPGLFGAVHGSPQEDYILHYSFTT